MESVDDEHRVVYLLANLPDSYKMLVMALEANKDMSNMETIIECLLNEEQKMKESECIIKNSNQRTIRVATKMGKPLPCDIC